MSQKESSLDILRGPKETPHPTFVQIDQQNRYTILHRFQDSIQMWDGTLKPNLCGYISTRTRP